ncbi:MAG: hypothetical protein ACOYOA_17060, partial [Saprospiraceae bacterium]
MQQLNIDVSNLEAISCQVIDSLPPEFSADFKVLYFGFYIHYNSMIEKTENFLAKASAIAGSESPYYILLANQISETGESKYFIELKLPQNWLTNCFDPLIVKTFEKSVKNKFETLNALYKSPSDRIALESEGLKYISTKFGKYTACCIPGAHQRGSPQCSDCISASNVLSELQNLGFKPIFAGQVTNSIATEDQNCLCTATESALRNNDVNGNRSSSVLDFANLSIVIDGLTYNFGQELSDWAAAGHKAIITKNKNYCTASLFSDQTNAFNNATNAAWVHIWENPIVTDYDIVFIKTKYNLNTSNTATPETTIQNVQADPLPPYKYKIMHRSFAPWDRFGHFPIFWNIHRARNSFEGDNRGFSLANSNSTSTPNPSGATARIHQSLSIQLDKEPVEKQDIAKTFNSTTKGYPFCVRDIITFPLQIPIIYAGHEVTVLGSSSGFGRCRKSNGIFFTSMFFEGSNPLFTPAPDIEWYLELGWYYTSSNKTVNISGRVIGKSYPAYEAFVEDVCGTKIFLHTYQAPCESALGGELLLPFPDYNEPFDLSLTTDS